MAVSGSSQALLAAFVFGIVATAASGAIIVYAKGRGLSLFRDGLRLVLIHFLVTSALWAIVQFISTLVSVNASSGCQIAIISASVNDQLARVSLQQFLVWALKGKVDFSISTILPQLVILGRFVVGAVFVALQRPQFSPVCVAQLKMQPLGVVLLVFDILIIIMLLTRAFFSGFFRNLRAVGYGSSRNTAVLVTIAGLGAWTMLSIPMTLGSKSFAFAVRTVIPAAGLLIVIAILFMVKSNLPLPDDEVSELRSGGDSWLDFTTGEEAASRGRTSSRGRWTRALSRAGSSTSPRPVEEPKAETAQVNPNLRHLVPSRDGNLPIISRPSPGQAEAGVGGIPVQGELFPPMRSQTAPVVMQGPNKPLPKRARKGSKLVISTPVLNDTGDQNPLNKVATVDLATAAKYDKERREVIPRSQFNTATTSSVSHVEMKRQSRGLRRKEIAPPAPVKPVMPSSEPNQDHLAAAATSSAQLSPGGDELRRRSPRSAPRAFHKPQRKPPAISIAPPTTNAIAVLSAGPPEPPPRSPRRPSPAAVAPSPKTHAASLPAMSPSESLKGRRVSPSSSPRKSRAPTRVFTDPTAPPALPPGLAVSHSKRLSQAQAASISPYVAPLQLSPKKANYSSEVQSIGQALSGPGINSRSQSVKTVKSIKMAAGTSVESRSRHTSHWIGGHGAAQPQTVMFVNRIEYSDPSAVEFILSGAGEKGSGYVQSPLNSQTRYSVLHRPRPIPRNSSISSSMWPSDDSAHFRSYKQSPSSASFRERKWSILTSREALAAQLGRRPSQPVSAGAVEEVLDIMGKSVDVTPLPITGEPSGSEIIQRPRSCSMPQLLPIPVPVVIATEPSSPTAVPHQKLASPLYTGNSALSPGTQAPVRPSGSYSATTLSAGIAYSPNDEPHSGVSRPSVYSFRSEGRRRQSSPVIPIGGLLSPPLSGESKSGDEAYDSESAYSPVGTARSQPSQYAEELPSSHYNMTPVFTIGDDGKEMMTIMLEPAPEHEQTVPEVPRRSEVRSLYEQRRQSRWHRRVGDECPTFSERAAPTMTRRVQRPPPLQLYQPPKMATIVEAEASPLESPASALDKIQQQLANLDGPEDKPASNDEQRMTLLANLESEMGAQENQWQKMRQDLAQCLSSGSKNMPSQRSCRPSVENSPSLDRLSQSTLATAKSGDWEMPRGEARVNNSDLRILSARRNSNVLRQLSSGLPQDSDLLRAEDAHRQRSINSGSSAGLLSVANRTIPLPGSMTPPDSDESESEDEAELPFELDLRQSHERVNFALWRPAPVPAFPLQIAKPETLWTPPNAGDHTSSPAFADHPATTIRPVTRKIVEPLEIKTCQLWSPSLVEVEKTSSSGVVVGLWSNSSLNNNNTASSASPVSPAPPSEPAHLSPTPEPTTVAAAPVRPRATRPPRRSKRISQLPDIIENPEPLFNSRGTLGLYQFSWGEKSDIASLQPRTQAFTSGRASLVDTAIPVAIPGLDARPTAVGSSSFFDESDEENRGDNFAEYSHDSSDDEDDDFDETTLWEIASLLKSDEVPSRESLFAGGAQVVDEPLPMATERFSADLSANEEAGGFQYDNVSIIPEPKLLASPKKDDATLWAQDASRLVPLVAPTGLANPHESTWQSYIDNTSTFVRAPTRKAVPAPAASSTMWAAQPKEKQATVNETSLWSNRNSVNETTDVTQEPQEQRVESQLWSPPAPAEIILKGLPQPQSWSAYLLAKARPAQTKPRLSVLTAIESASLWTSPIASGPVVFPSPSQLWCNSPLKADKTSAAPSKQDQASPFSIVGKRLSKASATATDLWSSRSSSIIKDEEQSQGLFNPQHTRTDLRTSDQVPAALAVRPVARSKELPLHISSSSLWTHPVQQSYAQDWISLSSVRPWSPGAASSAADDDCTVADSSSIRSFGTAPSTVGSAYTDYIKGISGPRIKATPEEWDTALEEAILASDD